MTAFLWFLAFAWATTTMVAPAQSADPDTLMVSAVRFYQADGGGTTVEVLAELRTAVVTPGSGALARYRFTAEVRDSAGMLLADEGWDREIAGDLARAAGATTVEGFRFSAAAGRYTVRLRAASAGGTSVTRELAVDAFGGRPPSSDLLLAAAVRRVPPDSGDLAPGEVRRAGLAMRGAPIPRVSLEHAVVSYYTEIYPWQGTGVEGRLWVEVNDTAHRRLIGTSPQLVQLPAAGGVARGSLDLTGLPVGRYTMRVLVRIGDSTVASEAPFAVAAPTSIVVRTASPAPPADRFEAATEQQLDSLYAPLVYLLEENEQGVYGNLSVAGKRRFLQEFWRRRDPAPNEPGNPVETEFYRNVTFVNESFREGGAAQIEGWRTDRGRVYLRNGRPDEVLRRPTAQPRPYEAWKYTRGRQRFFVFWDRSGLGHYMLIGTSDRRESSLPDWESYLGPEGSQDVADFIR